MPEGSASPGSPDPTLDPVDHLPLTLLRSETIPPAPTRSVSTIDWLPDFGGYSWIAYGASSLLVISHFPSPLSPDETLIGPILRQVLELSRDDSSPVSSVSWSPVTPSVGELAAAFDNCIVIFAHDSATSKGSFCWSQNAVLVQSTKVEAIKWAGSGDGIIAGGIDVVLWRRNNMSWEIAWKLRRDEPQNLVSATWSIEGPSACASSPKESHSGEGNEMSKCVLVCYNAGGSEYARSDLHHPLPVSIIQWRPLTGVQLHGDGQQLRRHVLFSCCLDGTIRLWTQVDSGKVRKLGKDNNDHKPTKRSFCVAAVIEINQALNGTLGSDVFLTWAIEIGGVYQNSEGANEFFASEQHRPDEVGRCEWLIGFGPGKLVTFWAIHCLDDMSPLRYPRITLWKRQELQDIDVGHLHRAGSSHFKGALPLEKVVILRNCLSGPPDMCSFIHLTPANSLARSLLYTKRSSNSMGTFIKNCRTDNDSSYSTSGVLSAGHSGKILQVAIHPQTYELVVSLDSNGLLLFWLLSSVLNCYLGLSTLVPAWKLGGKLATNDLGTKYTSLRWAPSILDEDHVLLMGHTRGIDCFIVRNSEIGDDIVCYYISTIPLTDDGPYEDGPEYVFTIPLPSICDKTFKNNRFLLLAVWTKFFRALSCEVTLHSYDSLEHCHGCNFHDENRSSVWEFEKTLANKRYLLSIKLWSSQFPDPHLHDQITSFCVVCPDNLILPEESLDHKKNLCYGVPAYVMATGWSDGSVKLWRSSPAEDSSNCTPWELVGSFVAHQGPVSAICSNGTGLKIATVSTRSHLEGVSILHIWDTVHLKGTGCFILEDRLSIERPVAALRWLMLGNGQSCLGVCLQNELQLYAQKRCSGQTFWNPEKSLNVGSWSCIAVGNNFPDIHDFLWGPQATAIVVHSHYFSLVGQQLFLVDHKQYAQSCANCSREAFGNREDKDMLCTIFTDCDIECSSLQAPFIKDSSGEDKCSPQEKIDMKSDCPSNCSSVFRAQLKHVSTTMLGFWNLVEIAEKLGGNLPVYHPETLLMNIYSGNWKRAYLSLKHLVEYLSSRHASEASYSYAKSSHIVPQIDLSNYFDGLLLKDSTDKQFQWTADSRLPASSSELSAFDLTASSSNVPFGSTATKSEDTGFAKTLEKFYDLAALSNVEKLQILAIIDLLSEIQYSASAYENLDEPGRRFWVALKFQQLNFSRNFGRLPNVEELVANSRLMSWAFHSDCQETLLSSFLPSEPSWKEMQTLGVGFWFTNVAQLRTKMEKLARLLYLRRKDPKDCALLYIALNRLQVLAGLFKISRDEKDKPLVGFLSRNFQEDKNKAAALKNAYVLMGRHQLEMAVAFFLLGGDTYSAITVCAKNLGDEQLALVLCRLVEGHGGPLEQHLITKFILPSASERGDFWLVSLLEWEMGNYYQSFLSILGPVIDESALSSNHAAFMDPHIGLHCLSLATKNGMRNTIGDQNAAILVRWATFMAAAAFNRCGLPLEALECLSSSPGILAGMDHGSASENDIPQMLNGLLKPSARESNNWLLDDVASLLESHHKLDLGLQYFSKLAREHPSWPETIVESVRLGSFSKENEMHEYEKSLESFKEKLYKGVIKFEQKFLVFSSALIKMISFWLSRIGLWFIGYEILLDHTSQNDPHNKSSKNGNFMVYCHLHKPFLRTTEDISVLLSRFIASCTITCCKREPSYAQNDVSVQDRLSNSQEHCFQGINLMLQSLRAALRIFSGPGSKDLSRLLPILDLYEYYLHFAFAWLQRNSKSLFFMVQPLLISFTNGHTPYEVDMANLNSILHHVPEFSVFAIGNHEGAEVNAIPHLPHRQDAEVMHSFSEDEKWYVIGACLWQYMSRFMDHKLHAMSITYEDLSSVPNGKFLTWASSSNNVGSDGNCKTEKLGSLSLVLARLLKSTLLHISSYHVKMLGSFLQWKLENRLPISTLGWLKESKPSHSKSPNLDGSLGVVNDIDESTVFERLWITCADPTIVSEGFAQEKISRMEFLQNKSSIEWRDIYAGISREHEMKEIFNHEAKVSNSPSIEEAGSLGKGLLKNSRIFLNSWQKDVTAPKEASYFHNAKEIHKREGELLEALCINSINECQAAVASNRKGIVFFRLEDGMSFGDESKYIWSDADWPPNGWAGANSTPVPTYVSPGVGLGSKKGSHLGLGGATIGMGASARPRRDSIGGGAFGVPGYAGIGSSSIGWEVQEDFEDFVDPPATVENINTRAFSSHPSRPFFLVGSSNTHIYLWEFGKDKATATYGVLPAANVPPPYALASISALQFDHCGHRFATAALDGTVCTWQLEVGGRSNIKPTESSLCFNGYALDVTYVTSSGSVIAASGFSNNGVNVVVWDTLAPPTTSQASIACHEGGARSISVFDNDLGSGSISPLIVTGGKEGDVGLHDFRYIATGRTKRHRHVDNNDASSQVPPNTDNKVGDQNLNGMLWYIPKAHLGSVTKISTIPHTSLFLTGSKDGDVKLWDAKAAKLVYHWPKLHDRHTFLQPSSRGFGGVVRAAVTDIQVVSHGFLTCGGDGTVRLVQLKDFQTGTR